MASKNGELFQWTITLIALIVVIVVFLLLLSSIINFFKKHSYSDILFIAILFDWKLRSKSEQKLTILQNPKINIVKTLSYFTTIRWHEILDMIRYVF